MAEVCFLSALGLAGGTGTTFLGTLSISCLRRGTPAWKRLRLFGLLGHASKFQSLIPLQAINVFLNISYVRFSWGMIMGGTAIYSCNGRLPLSLNLEDSTILKLRLLVYTERSINVET